MVYKFCLNNNYQLPRWVCCSHPSPPPPHISREVGRKLDVLILTRLTMTLGKLALMNLSLLFEFRLVNALYPWYSCNIDTRELRVSLREISEKLY